MPVSKTHPWIDFQLDLRRVNYKVWMLLGEVRSKCEHLAGSPLHPDIQDELHALYLAKGIHATTAIEGNTLTENQVRARIDKQLSLPPSQEYMAKEIDNILDACNKIMGSLVDDGPTGLSMKEIKVFNYLVLNGLNLEDGVVPGDFRSYMVGVGKYRGVPPEHISYLLDKTCKWLNGEIFIPSDDLIAFGLMRAILSHLYIAWIHPFGDGNGRTARLVEFKILLAHGVSSAAAHLLSNHYNLTRNEYYRQLDRASESRDVIPFIEYALTGFLDGLKEHINVVKEQQMKIIWKDHVYNSFRNKSGKVVDRRRRLALDISEHSEPVPLKDFRMISPRVAELYAGKTYRAIIRDVTALLNMKLIVRVPKGYKANVDIIKAFLPVRIQ